MEANRLADTTSSAGFITLRESCGQRRERTGQERQATHMRSPASLSMQEYLVLGKMEGIAARLSRMRPGTSTVTPEDFWQKHHAIAR